MSPGTASRAYVEAERQGLVEGQVGRGTFVLTGTVHRRCLPGQGALQDGLGEEGIAAVTDISVNTPSILSHNIVLAEAFASLSQQGEAELHNRYLPYTSHPQHRAAAIVWLGKHGVDVPGDDIVLTNGARHAMAVAISSIAKAGDILFTDPVTYPGMIALANHLDLVLEAVDGDDEGMTPEGLHRAAGRCPAKGFT